MKLNTRQSVLMIAAIGSIALLSACAARIAEKTNADAGTEGVEPIYKFAGAVALNGYDPVAYFDEGKATAGSDQFVHEWNGAKWQFASAADRDAFASQPEKYAPQYGGYCAWAVSHGYTAKGDPEAWKIVDGKLYVNYNKDVKARWEQDVPGFISKGNENWPRFLKEKPEHKGE